MPQGWQKKVERHDCATEKVTIYIHLLFHATKHYTIKICKVTLTMGIDVNKSDGLTACRQPHTRVSSLKRITGVLIVQLYYHESQSNLCPTWQVFWLIPLSHGLPILGGQ